MKKMALLSTFLALPLIFGCAAATSTTPPTALAPRYTSAADQAAGQTLAAAHALVSKAVTDYTSLTPAQQATVKGPLNAFVTAVNTADSIYIAFHAGTATITQVNAAVTQVTSTQTAYTTASGVQQ